MNKEKVSKSLSYFLRHSPDHIDKTGWADVDKIVSVLNKQYPNFVLDDLFEIVQDDPKGRYLLSPMRDRITATYGHSVPIEVELETPRLSDIPETLFHGTARRFLTAIRTEGLLPMSRQFVHLSVDRETAQTVGRRHGPAAVLYIDARRLAENGLPLFRAKKGIWLAPAVPAKYIRVWTESDQEVPDGRANRCVERS